MFISSDYVQNELLENPVLEAEKSYDAQEVDIREKIREADYEEESFRQWEYRPDEDDDYTYEQYVYEEDTLTDYLMSQLQFSRLTGQMAAIGRYIIEVIDDNGYLTMSVEEISKAVGADIDTVEEVLNFVQTFDCVFLPYAKLNTDTVSVSALCVLIALSAAVPRYIFILYALPDCPVISYKVMRRGVAVAACKIIAVCLCVPQCARVMNDDILNSGNVARIVIEF